MLHVPESYCLYFENETLAASMVCDDLASALHDANVLMVEQFADCALTVTPVRYQLAEAAANMQTIEALRLTKASRSWFGVNENHARRFPAISPRAPSSAQSYPRRSSSR